MDPIYNIDYTKLVKWLTPPRIRSEIMLNWLKALVSPIQTLYNDWKNYYQKIDKSISVNSQVCKLESYLNDLFDPVLRRITLTDTPENLVTLIHTDEAQESLLTYPEGSGNDAYIPIIHDESAYVDGTADFNVNIPAASLISGQQIQQMKSVLNAYKLASKRYKILYT